jgi:hypothetical protein
MLQDKSSFDGKATRTIYSPLHQISTVLPLPHEVKLQSFLYGKNILSI